jgi:glycosyltransferase involved in cell wall biosynthesis
MKKKIILVNTSKNFCGVDKSCICIFSLLKNDVDFFFAVLSHSDFYALLKAHSIEESRICQFSSNYFADILKFNHFIRRIEPDVINIHTAHDYYLTLLAKRYKAKMRNIGKQDLRIIISRHNSFKLNFFPNNLFLKQCDAIIAVSNYVKQKLSAQFPWLGEKIQVIHNTVISEYPEFKETGRTTKEASKPLSFGFIGRLIELKGLHLVLKALSCLRQKGMENFHLKIAGNFTTIKYKKYIYNLIDQLELSPHVEFLGFFNDVSQFYQKIDILVVPSLLAWEEAFGLVAIEGMAAKKPVISFRSGALPEIIQHGRTGLVCQNQTESSLAEAMEYFLNRKDQVLQMGSNGYFRFVKYFSPEIFKKKMQRIYELYSR